LIGSGLGAAAAVQIERATAPPHLEAIATASQQSRAENTMKTIAAGLLILAVSQAAADTNDYPTEARADYVFVCMKTNGETQEMLRRCSCSIDVIASLLPYDRYVAAQTVASMNQVQGQIGTMFRASQQTKSMLDDLRRAQAEAEIRCF
jgi:precorrin-6B methylase 2